MLNRILQQFKYVQELIKSRDEYRDTLLAHCDADTEEPITTPVSASEVIAQVMNRGIKWFDYNSLSFTEKRQYYADIQSVLRNKSLTNEINHIIADTVEFIAKSASSFVEVEKMRMQINALELLRERLESIENPEKIKEDFDPNSVL